MELLEFKNKMFELCNVDNTKDISNVLMNVVLSNDILFYSKFKEIISIDDTKDWIQALWQYYEADRTQKKQDYTPISLCKLVSRLAGKNKSVYDCCGGSGALTLQSIKDNNIDDVLIEELDSNVIPFLLFNLCLKNINGYVSNCDVLSKQVIKQYRITKSEQFSKCEIIEDIIEKKYDCSISNPPYNISWCPPLPLENDERFPVIPPKSSANYAFVLNCLSKSDKSVLILPCSVCTEKTEREIRQYLLENDLIEAVILNPDKMFECTSISTTILVLNKNKQHKNKIIFVDSRENFTTIQRLQNGQFGGNSHTKRTYIKEYKSFSDENISKILNAVKNQVDESMFSQVVENQRCIDNKCSLLPSQYIEFKEEEFTHRNIQEIADNISYIQRMRNSCKLVINETIAKRFGFDIDLFKESKQNSLENQKQMKLIGVNIGSDDYIQFTKNKNEFTFKCNDSEILSDIFSQMLQVWKNQIALLNTMENNYMNELRDAILPDLMSGKLEVKS